jgi:hypothetical protein
MKNLSAGIVLIAAIIISVVIIQSPGSDNSTNSPKQARQEIRLDSGNVEIRDGVQYVTIEASGGYSPEQSTAKAGVPTKLIVRTNGTYDCSSSLVVRAVGYQGILPGTGETEIDLGAVAAGEKITGVCSMGMYSFGIDFS